MNKGSSHRRQRFGIADNRRGHGGGVGADFRQANDLAEAVAAGVAIKAKRKRERREKREVQKAAEAKAKITLPTLRFMSKP
jgi:hypothetical protein